MPAARCAELIQSYERWRLEFLSEVRRQYSETPPKASSPTYAKIVNRASRTDLPIGRDCKSSPRIKATPTFSSNNTPQPTASNANAAGSNLKTKSSVQRQKDPLSVEELGGSITPEADLPLPSIEQLTPPGSLLRLSMHYALRRMKDPRPKS